MTATVFGIMAVVGYGMAVLCAFATVVFYVTRHVRAVRDELTGRTAARAIEDLRRGHGYDVARHAADRGTPDSLHVRHSAGPSVASACKATVGASGAAEGATAAVADADERRASTSASESVTTLLGAEPGAEEGTTLLAEGTSSEALTSLLDAREG